MEVVESYCGLNTEACLFALYECHFITIKFNLFKILFLAG